MCHFSLVYFSTIAKIKKNSAPLEIFKCFFLRAIIKYKMYVFVLLQSTTYHTYAVEHHIQYTRTHSSIEINGMFSWQFSCFKCMQGSTYWCMVCYSVHTYLNTYKLHLHTYMRIFSVYNLYKYIVYVICIVFEMKEKRNKY